MEGSTRTLSGITLIVLALFLAANYAARTAGLAEWGLVLVLGVVGLVLLFSDRLEARFRSAQADAPPPAVPVVYAAPVLPAAPPPTAEKQVQPLPFDFVPAAKTAPDQDVLISTPMQEALIDADVSNPPPNDLLPLAEEPIPEAAPVLPDDNPLVPAAVPAKPDDLTLIEGIGPKMSAALVASGIDSFDKLWKSSEETIRAAIQAAGMRFAPTIPTWAEQASYAANGDWAGLKTFQDTLKGGRKA